MNKPTITGMKDIIDGEQLRNIIKSPTKKLWQYCNHILYHMCKEQPSHDDVDIIASKLILIGRTYAAAIERRKTHDGWSNDKFYYEKVAPKIKEHSKDLDGRINSLKEKTEPTKDDIREIISIHKTLTDIFSELTEEDKRSLASKYLHFHCPNLFYIYDSRSSTVINKLVKKNSALIKELAPNGDETYADFAVRCLEIHEFAQEECGKSLTPRDIDDILLDLAEAPITL